ncbi:hypothetical protein ACS8E6_02400 [Salinicola halophyticus]|uniref:hypothetical protein n=1 Tax=Salinicola halophyticus TaxID=1808881 RepID=UPI003F47C52B
MQSNGPVFLVASSDEAYQSYFAGIAYTSSDIILGTGGAEDYFAEFGEKAFYDNVIDGRFFAFLSLGSELRAYTDPMGQDVLYYCLDDNGWAVSNSFYRLAQFLGKDRKLNLYKPALDAFFIANGNGFGAQPISNNTSISEIKVLPLGKIFKVDLPDNQARLIDAKPVLQSDESYEALIAKGLIESRDRLTAIARSGANLIADLSGGQDSRAVFGIARSSAGDDKGLRIVSNPRKEDDYRIAQSLAARYGNKIHHNSGASASTNGEAAYQLWKSGSLGVYLPVYPVNSEVPDYRKYKVNGGNALAKTFANLSAPEFVSHIEQYYADSQACEEVKKEFVNAIRDLGVEENDPDAMYLHYYNFRARFHYGRNWYASLISPVISPLINQHLLKAFFKLPAEERKRGRFFLDILMSLDPILALHPFDSPSKGFEVEDISRSPFWPSGSKSVIGSAIQTHYNIYSRETVLEAATNGGNFKGDFVGLMSDDLDFFAKNSSLVGSLFDKQTIKKAKKNLSGNRKMSDRARLASRIIMFGSVDELTL